MTGRTGSPAADAPVHGTDLVLDAGEHRLAATKVLPPEDAVEPTVLTLHGLGPTATRHSIRYVLDHLAGHGHASMCFEFSGNGDSTGLLAESSLRRRQAETLAAARHLDRGRAPVLVGTSMGAHLAASLVPELRPRALVLFVPAAYPDHAADLVFGEGFPRPGPYPDSPAFAGLREFDGDLLIVAGREDRVVPASVVDAYAAAAVGARSREVVWLDCDHYVHRWLPSRAPLRDSVLDAVLRTVTTSRTRD